MGDLQGLDITNHHQNCKYLVRDCACLTLKQVSDKWGVAESTLREKKAQGLTPTFFKLFGRIKTFECWFSVWLKEQQIEKPPAMRVLK
jgi:hypothetical protein